MAPHTRRTRGFTIAVATAALAGLALAGPAPASAASPSYTSRVIATGLNNPRGVDVGADGRVYVVEAGLGAGNPQAGVLNGLGNTGALRVIKSPTSSAPRLRTVVGHLPSAASDEGQGPEAVGPDGVYAFGTSDNVRLRVAIGAAGIPHSLYGHVITVRAADGRTTDLADVGSTNLAWTDLHKNEPWAPAGQFPDSNVYGVSRAQGRYYAIDAGANTLSRIYANGTVKVVAYFPNTPLSDAVPTCAAEGPDGALYVGTLALADFFTRGPGTATVYRVDPSQLNANSLSTVLSVAKPWATGFSTITGCNFDGKGNFYAAQMFANDVVKVPFAHPATGRSVIGAGLLSLPNGVSVGSGGTVYVSNMSDSTAAGAGSVVRFTPVG